MKYDETESRFGSLTLRSAEPELRTRVLAAVAEELEPPHRELWPHALLAVAAAVFVALGLNLGLDYRAERRLAELFGPPPVSKQAAEVARMVARVTDASTGRWVYERLTAKPNTPADPAEYFGLLQRMVDECVGWVERTSPKQFDAKDPFSKAMDSTPQKAKRAPPDATNGWWGSLAFLPC